MVPPPELPVAVQLFRRAARRPMPEFRSCAFVERASVAPPPNPDQFAVVQCAGNLLHRPITGQCALVQNAVTRARAGIPTTVQLFSAP